MASAKWEGGKCKGASEAKAMLRHDAVEKDRRAIAAKKNTHIDPAKADSNFTMYGRSYEQTCTRYDGIMERIASTNTNKRKDAVTMQVIEVPAPEGLDSDRLEEWFRRVGGIIEHDVFGTENFVEGFVHADEIHDYTDPETKEKVPSRVHAHYAGVPVVDGSLNGKKVSAKRNIIKLNTTIEKMTQNEFGCGFMTGKKTKSTKTVETLKTDSMLAEMRQDEQARLEHAEQLERDAMERYRRSYRECEQMLKDARDEAARIVREAVKERDTVLYETRRMREEQSNIYLERFRDTVRRGLPDLSEPFRERYARHVKSLPGRVRASSDRGINPALPLTDFELL